MQNEDNERFSSPNINGEDSDSFSRYDVQSISDVPYFAQNNIDSESENSSYESLSDKDDLNTENIHNKHMALRASTAPSRPLTEIEEFRRSSDYLLLEHTILCSSKLSQRIDNKYDLDSDHGQRCCKKLLNQLENLCETFKVKCASRDYRNHFSKAYKVLYKEGSLCYLTEILDSAQEGFPYLYVNGEKYVFSSEVLQAGTKLFTSFMQTQMSLKDIFNKVNEEAFVGFVESIRDDICNVLQDFDNT